MRSIPVATDRMAFFAAAVTQAEQYDETTRLRSPKITPDGEQVWKFQVLVRIDGEDKGELIEVQLVGARPEVDPFAEVEFANLTARPWLFNGAAGVSFAADGVSKAAHPNGRRPAPSVPGSES